jgi:hypothetical protein
MHVDHDPNARESLLSLINENQHAPAKDLGGPFVSKEVATLRAVLTMEKRRPVYRVVRCNNTFVDLQPGSRKGKLNYYPQ